MQKWTDKGKRSWSKKKKDLRPDVPEKTRKHYEIKEVTKMEGDVATVDYEPSYEPLVDYVISLDTGGSLNQQFLDYLKTVADPDNTMLRREADTIIQADTNDTTFIVNPMIEHIHRIVGHLRHPDGSFDLNIEWNFSEEDVSALPAACIRDFWRKNPDHPENPDNSAAKSDEAVVIDDSENSELSDAESDESTKTPTKTPKHAPAKTSTKTPPKTPKHAPPKTPTKTPPKTPKHAPPKTPTKTPPKTPTKTPPKTPTKTPPKTPKHAPAKTPTKTPPKTPVNKSHKKSPITKSPITKSTKTPPKTPVNKSHKKSPITKSPITKSPITKSPITKSVKTMAREATMAKTKSDAMD